MQILSTAFIALAVQTVRGVVKLFFARVLRRAASWRVHVYSVGWSEHVGRNGDRRDRGRWSQAARD